MPTASLPSSRVTEGETVQGDAQRIKSPRLQADQVIEKGAMAQTADDGHPALTPSGMRADVCPVCEGPNECGGAAGKVPCWCSSVKISLEALVAMPAEARERICMCPRCAATAPWTRLGLSG